MRGVETHDVGDTRQLDRPDLSEGGSRFLGRIDDLVADQHLTGPCVLADARRAAGYSGLKLKWRTIMATGYPRHSASGLLTKPGQSFSVHHWLSSM